jgi:hypothetical protein
MSIDISALLRDVAERSERVGLADPAAVRRAGERRARGRQLRVIVGLAFAAAVAVALGRGPLGHQADPLPGGPVPTPSPTVTSTAGTNVGASTFHVIETGRHRFAAHAIAVRHGRFVVVGDSSDFERVGPPVYWSDDAVRWQASPAGGAPDSANVTDVIATGSGFLAVGVDARGPAAWRSVDGRTWVRAPVDAPGQGSTGALWGITGTPLGYFAWGFDNGHARLLRSPDGTAWARAGDQRVFDLPRSESICAVREVSGRLTAVGLVAPHNSREGRRVVWSSTNGSDWVLSQGPGEPMIWCDPPDVLGHLEASSANVGQVRIDPNGDGNEVEVSAREP